MAGPVDTLILVPTAGERDALTASGAWPTERVEMAIAGFGPVAAAARSAELIARHSPRRVLLLGIAGGYDVEQLPLGAASEFAWVAMSGIGAGEGTDALGPAELGFPQWPGHDGDGDGEAITDRVSLSAAREGAPGLVTVCSASHTPESASRRAARFPGALAEDMEGFGVALACAIASVPLRIVRGIANRAGDRDRDGWCIPRALVATRVRALGILDEECP